MGSSFSIIELVVGLVGIVVAGGFWDAHLTQKKSLALCTEQFGTAARVKLMTNTLILPVDHGTLTMSSWIDRSGGRSVMKIIFEPKTTRPWLEVNLRIEEKSTLTHAEGTCNLDSILYSSESTKFIEALFGMSTNQSALIQGAHMTCKGGVFTLMFESEYAGWDTKGWDTHLKDMNLMLPFFEDLERHVPHTMEEVLCTFATHAPHSMARQRIYADLLTQRGGQDSVRAYLREKLDLEPESVVFHLAKASHAPLLHMLSHEPFSQARAITLACMWRTGSDQDPALRAFMEQAVFPHIELKQLDKHYLPYVPLLCHHLARAQDDTIEYAQSLFERMTVEELCEWFEAAGALMVGAQRRALVEHILSRKRLHKAEVRVLGHVLTLAAQDPPGAHHASWWQAILPKLAHALTPKTTAVVARLVKKKGATGQLSVSDIEQSGGDLSVVHGSKGQLSETEDS